MIQYTDSIYNTVHCGILSTNKMLVLDLLQTPVIAANSGGPKETVLSGETGFLCENTPDSFAASMLVYCTVILGFISLSIFVFRFRFVREENLSRDMGAAGRKRVKEAFSFEQFTLVLCAIIQSIVT